MGGRARQLSGNGKWGRDSTEPGPLGAVDLHDRLNVVFRAMVVMSFGGTEGSRICENWLRIAGSLVVVVGWLPHWRDCRCGERLSLKNDITRCGAMAC